MNQCVFLLRERILLYCFSSEIYIYIYVCALLLFSQNYFLFRAILEIRRYARNLSWPTLVTFHQKINFEKIGVIVFCQKGADLLMPIENYLVSLSEVVPGQCLQLIIL